MSSKVRMIALPIPMAEGLAKLANVKHRSIRGQLAVIVSNAIDEYNMGVHVPLEGVGYVPAVLRNPRGEDEPPRPIRVASYEEAHPLLIDYGQLPPVPGTSRERKGGGAQTVAAPWARPR